MERHMLKDQVAIITGGSRGIGRAIAERFAAEGAAVLLVATTPARLEAAAEAIRSAGGRVAVLAGDVADPAVAERARDLALGEFGRLDILVNCAGIISRTPVEDLPLAEWHRVLDVNLHGTFHFCRAAIPLLVARGRGRVINMTSQMAKLPHPSAAPSYEVSKAGIVALTRHLALRYARAGVCVNAIAPGSIDTDMPKSMTAEARERLRQAIPMGRLGLPDEVASCALFLASSLADYVTGEILDVNGGTLMD